jgi:hypothetical protein
MNHVLRNCRSALLLTLAIVFGSVATSSARAGTVNFDFSFTGDLGTVTGETNGLTVGATSSAAAVYVDSYPSGEGYTTVLPLSFTTISNNSFTVESTGALIFANFAGSINFDANTSASLSLHLNDSLSSYFEEDITTGSSVTQIVDDPLRL